MAGRRVSGAGPPTPVNSRDGGGFRAIPDRTCIEQFLLVPPANGRTTSRRSMSLGNCERRGLLAGHFVDINANQLSNEDGPEIWYTDAFGRHGKSSSFPGSVRQRLARMDNQIGVDAGGPVIGDNRNYSGAGVHAPN